MTVGALESRVPFLVDEFEDRLRRTQLAMAEADVDGLLLHAQESVYWLSGYTTTAFFPHTCLLVPASGPPSLVIWSIEEASAAASVWFDDIVIYQEEADAPLAICDTLRRLGLSGARLGIEERSWYLTVARFDALEQALPGAHFVKTGPMMSRLRAVKSEAEIACIRKAARIVEAGMSAALDATRAGCSEREIVATMAQARILAGSDLPIDGAITTGERTAETHATWSDRLVRRGDLFRYEVHGIANCYWARATRSGSIGHASDGKLRTHAILKAAVDNAIGMIKPGVAAASIDRLLRDPLVESGLKDRNTFTRRLGYGLGLHFRPSPGEFDFEISPSATFRMEAGMVFNVFAHAEGLGVSDTVLVGAAGGERLTELRSEFVTR